MTTPNAVEHSLDGTAVFSADREFRYRLTRAIGGTGGTYLFVMLNPSTADAFTDDQTITKCKFFAEREGAGTLDVVNLYAYRTSRPKLLALAGYPIGQDNDRHITDAAVAAAAIILAYGAIATISYARSIRVRTILRQAAPTTPLLCLGRTKGGHPRHPCYLAHATEIEVFA